MTTSDSHEGERLTNKQFSLYCPRCGSTNFYFRVKKDDYLCRKCGEAFLDDSQGLLIPDKSAWAVCEIPSMENPNTNNDRVEPIKSWSDKNKES